MLPSGRVAPSRCESSRTHQTLACSLDKQVWFLSSLQQVLLPWGPVKTMYSQTPSQVCSPSSISGAKPALVVVKTSSNAQDFGQLSWGPFMAPLKICTMMSPIAYSWVRHSTSCLRASPCVTPENMQCQLPTVPHIRAMPCMSLNGTSYCGIAAVTLNRSPGAIMLKLF